MLEKRERVSNREFRGGSLSIQDCSDREVLLEGPAGTGKSVADLAKAWRLAGENPGFRCLILRKTRASLTDTTLVTLEQDIIPAGHPALGGARRENRHSYQLPNGAEIVLGGLDKSTRVLSSQYDLVVIPEANEITEDDWETVLTRLRNGKGPYHQAIADCNPDAPSHWLNQRALSGRMTRFKTRHEHNPAYHDGNDWTQAGKDYVLDVLGALTGLRRKRYLEGIWAAAEGVIFDQFDPEVHIVSRFDPPQEWRRVWSLDFGYTNPFVWGSWAIDPDGRAYLHRQAYRTRWMVEDAAREIVSWSAGDPRPEAIVCDHDAEDRATFERHSGLKTSAAHKAVTSGIQAVSERLRPAGDGKPRLFVMEGSLMHQPDTELVRRRVPWCTEQEFETYIWDERRLKSKGDVPVDMPVKVDDHGMDMLRYTVAYLDMLDRRPVTKNPRPTAARMRNLNAGYV